MDTDKLNKWLSVVANFGVVAGIIFLAIEVRQNQSILEDANQINFLNARAISLETFNDFRNAVVQDEQLSRIWFDGLAGQELEPLAHNRFLLLCSSRIWLAATQWERGIILGDITSDNQITGQARWLNLNPGYKVCWDDSRRSLIGYGFGDYVNAVESKAGLEDTD